MRKFLILVLAAVLFASACQKTEENLPPAAEPEASAAAPEASSASSEAPSAQASPAAAPSAAGSAAP